MKITAHSRAWIFPRVGALFWKRTNQSLCASNKRKSCVGVFVQTSPSIPDDTLSLWFIHLFWALFVISYSNQNMDAFIVQSKQVNHAHTSNLPPTHYHLSRNTINISLKTYVATEYSLKLRLIMDTVSLNFVESVYLQTSQELHYDGDLQKQ